METFCDMSEKEEHLARFFLTRERRRMLRSVADGRTTDRQNVETQIDDITN
jgi:hypothetical protein